MSGVSIIRATRFEAAGSRNARAFLACIAVIVLLPVAAQADFGVQSFSATTLQSDGTTLFTQAGGHPSFGVTSFTIKTAGGLPDGGFPGGVLKNIHVDVPPGVL